MKTWKKLALVAIIAIFGLVGFIACEDKDDGGTTDPFEGTWVGMVDSTTYKWVAKNGSFVMYADNTYATKGTYSLAGNTVTITMTHFWNDPSWTETTQSPTMGVISGNTFTHSGNTFTKQ